MKSDLDRLMAEANLDAIVVIGDEAPNPYRDYLTNRSKANGSVIKKRGENGVFILRSNMERGEAASSGLKIYTLHDFGESDLRKKYGAQRDLVTRELFCNILRQLEIEGRVAFFGVADVNLTLLQLSVIEECMPDLQVIAGGEAAKLLQQAYTTKDEYEIAELKKAAHLTSQIVRNTWDFIAGHRADGERVVDSHGEPLTIGKVKAFIRQREIELGLENPEGVIFAQGRDAGIPHSEGNDEDTLLLGQSIVFDYFPKTAKSGYFHDMTRTWCIGYAPLQVQAAYDDVMHAFQLVRDTSKVGESTATYQTMVCDYFESKGHPTPRSQPGTEQGYVHSLGHGLGLNIHEAPLLGIYSDETLAAGNVFTIEPGLYYPDSGGYGVRIEDTVYLDSDGKLQTLTDFPYDLVLPLKG
jgi:Xaa-Pro aminopeptidase